MAQEETKVIMNLQDRKDLGIAFFNATNSAISLITAMPAFSALTDEQKKQALIEWRDFFLSEHGNFRKTVVANMAASFKPKDTIDRLALVKSMDELQNIWLLLTQDERQDETIREEFTRIKETLVVEKPAKKKISDENS